MKRRSFFRAMAIATVAAYLRIKPDAAASVPANGKLFDLPHEPRTILINLTWLVRGPDDIWREHKTTDGPILDLPTVRGDYNKIRLDVSSNIMQPQGEIALIDSVPGLMLQERRAELLRTTEPLAKKSRPFAA